MDERDALAALGLQGPADAALVKRTYRRLARELHPDAGGDATRFVEVQTAFEVLANGTDAVITGRRPQQRAAGVAHRWWESAAAWHTEPVDITGIDLARTVPDAPATRVDVHLLASLLQHAEPVAPVVLRSRSPRSRLHAMIAWLQPDLLASIVVAPAADGPRAGHDVDVTVRASAGRGRRLLADVELPSGWNRGRGSESVRVERRLRPSRAHRETVVRVATEVAELAAFIGWPLEEWFVLREGGGRPT